MITNGSYSFKLFILNLLKIELHMIVLVVRNQSSANTAVQEAILTTRIRLEDY